MRFSKIAQKHTEHYNYGYDLWYHLISTKLMELKIFTSYIFNTLVIWLTEN